MATLRDDFKKLAGLNTLYYTVGSEYNVDNHTCEAPPPPEEAPTDGIDVDIDLRGYLDENGTISTAWHDFLNGASRGLKNDAKMASRAIAALDADGDNVITIDEYKQAEAEMDQDQLNIAMGLINTQVGIWEYLSQPEKSAMPPYPELAACEAKYKAKLDAVRTATTTLTIERNARPTDDKVQLAVAVASDRGYAAGSKVWGIIGGIAGFVTGALLLHKLGSSKLEMVKESHKTKLRLTEEGHKAQLEEAGQKHYEMYDEARQAAKKAQSHATNAEALVAAAEGRATKLTEQLDKARSAAAKIKVIESSRKGVKNSQQVRSSLEKLRKALSKDEPPAPALPEAAPPPLPADFDPTAGPDAPVDRIMSGDEAPGPM